MRVTSIIFGWFAATTIALAQTMPTELFSVGGITINSSSFDDVQSVFGTAKRTRVDQTQHSDESICYQASGLKGPVSIQFLTGPLGGWRLVTGFQLTAGSNNKCSVTRVQLSKINVGGVELGFTKQKIATLLRRPDISKRSNWSFEETYQRELHDTEKAAFKSEIEAGKIVKLDVVDSVRLKFSESKLQSIMVQRLASY